MFRIPWKTILPLWLGAMSICVLVTTAPGEEPAREFPRDAEGQPLAMNDDGWRIAVPGWAYRFPRDHFSHPDFKTEWWYFTGHLEGEETGAEYGFQLTFFRQGVIPAGERLEPGGERPVSRWITSQMSFAHFAVSEVDKRDFHFAQTVARGAMGEAGFGEPSTNLDEPQPLAWINGWTLDLVENTDSPGGVTYSMTAKTPEGVTLELQATPDRPPVFHGANGVSQKSAGLGAASHYYSFTRMTARGTLTLPGREPEAVSGTSWFDQEWASNQLSADQVGWDWFSLKFDDGAELMLYQLRLADGSGDPASKGTYVSPDGETVSISSQDYSLIPLKTWKSPGSGGEYPLSWRIIIPGLNLDITTQPAFERQELLLDPIIYWEGVVKFSTSPESTQQRDRTGTGYMELTGYAAPLEGIRGQGS